MHFIGDTLSIRGGNWSDYWNQFLGNIHSYTMLAKEPPDPIIYKTKKAHARNQLLLLGLMDASSKDSSVPNIDLSGDRVL